MSVFTFAGVPIDSVGRSGGGLEHGPRALRELGLVEALEADDRGDLEVRIRGDRRDPATGLLASDDVLATTEKVRKRVAVLVEGGRRPFLAGGCCAELPGALAGAREAVGPVGLVHLDGHADLYDGETSTTGEAADMPAAVALGLGPEAWVQACGGPTVGPQHLALLGYRDREESIADGMRQPESLSPTPILRPLEQVRAAGPEAVAAELTARLESSVPFWLHFDVDVLDQDLFPATDYPMPGGASWEEVGALLTPLLGSPALIGASLACYNPDKDPGQACGRTLVEELGRAAAGA
jgi:arginase